MNTNQEYISDEDLDYLDNFLLDRIDENADTEGKDEGILWHRGRRDLILIIYTKWLNNNLIVLFNHSVNCLPEQRQPFIRDLLTQLFTDK